MAKTNSVIEINGYRYNVGMGRTTDLIKKSTNSLEKSPPRIMDGFTRQQIISSTPIENRRVKVLSEKQFEKVYAKRSGHKAQSVHKNLQRSQALMRGAVSKPKNKSTASTSRPTPPITRKSVVDTSREERAQRVVKNTNIQRFGTSLSPKLQISQNSKHDVGGTGSVHKQKLPNLVKQQPKTDITKHLSSNQLERLLDQALLTADSHKKISRSHESKSTSRWRATATPRWVSLGACLLIVFLLGGFFTWQNVPQVSMKLAASRASIPASVPSYTPPGFSFSGPIGYSNGEVSIKFKANSDHLRNFTITQSKTAWNSQSLPENESLVNSKVQLSQNGTTVYIYGSSNDAKWVNQGVMYSIKDKANLTSDQIIKIAGSM
ncbi:DUF4367 domain-containing protein [Candidatus Saccharibacteria bacterium]|nr:DUF4367 domain-containing protein [Candidatus Saccharibacteria bacterium]